MDEQEMHLDHCGNQYCCTFPSNERGISTIQPGSPNLLSRRSAYSSETLPELPPARRNGLSIDDLRPSGATSTGDSGIGCHKKDAAMACRSGLRPLLERSISFAKSNQDVGHVG